METNKYKLKIKIKLRTAIPLLALICVLVLTIILEIVYKDDRVKSITGGVYPISLFSGLLFLAHGLTTYATFIKEEPESDYMMLVIDWYVFGGVILSVIIFFMSYISYVSVIGENLLKYYNILIFFVAVSQVFCTAVCLLYCRNAVRNREDFESKSEYIKKAGRYKYAYLILSASMIVATVFMME